MQPRLLENFHQRRDAELEYQVVWNGTTQREHTERNRVYLKAVPLSAQRRFYRDAVLAVLSSQPGKAWRYEDLLPVTQIRQTPLQAAIAQLKTEGLIVTEYVQERRGQGHARTLRVWIAG